MSQRYKVLMIKDNFIDIPLLVSGTFVTDSPTLLTAELSDERLFEDHLEEIIMDGNNRMKVNRFHDNWKKCKIVEIEIKFL